jgi:hypothetical protein
VLPETEPPTAPHLARLHAAQADARAAGFAPLHEACVHLLSSSLSHLPALGQLLICCAGSSSQEAERRLDRQATMARLI